MSLGTRELELLLARSSPILDINMLIKLDQLATSKYTHDLLVSKWEQAQSAHSQNEKFYTEWIKSSLGQNDIERAQKAALKGMSVSKQKRHFFLQTVAYSHILATAPVGVVSDQTQKIHASLAVKYLSTAATRIVADDDFVASFGHFTLLKKQALQTTQALKPIDVSSITLQTPRDLQFLLHVFRRQGQSEAALTIILDDKRTGLRSAIAAGSWSLLKEFLKIFEACKKWDQIWQICHDVLSDASLARSGKDASPVYSYGSIGDDFNVWKTLARSAAEIGSDKVISETNAALDSLDRLDLRSRILARLELELHPRRQTSSVEPLRTTLFDYIHRFCASPSLFKDLSYFFPRVPASVRKDLVFEIQKTAREIIPNIDGREGAWIRWIKGEINVLKLEYNLIISYNENLPNVDLLESFATSCLDLYRLSLGLEQDLPTTERRCGDDAAILAAMTFVHLAHLQNSPGLLQSAVILERLLVQSPHNYDALLLLIRIYINMGAVSRAFDTYEKLDIKNIQGFTVSWLLLTRISTLHPHYSKTYRCSPHGLISEYLQWLNEKLTVRQRFQQKYIENDNAVGFCEMYRLIEMLDKSCSRLILDDEWIRIARCVGDQEMDPPGSCKRPAVDASNDVRDSSAVPSYEHHKQPTMDQYIRPGPIPSQRWDKFQTCLNILHLVFRGYDDVDRSIQQFQQFEVRELISSNVKARSPQNVEPDCNNTESVMELTCAERQVLELAGPMIKALHEMASLHEDLRSRGTIEFANLQSCVDRLEEFETMLHEGVSAVYDYYMISPYWDNVSKNPSMLAGSVDWQFFHDCYVKLDFGELYNKFLHVVEELRKIVMKRFIGHPSYQPKLSSFTDATVLRQKVLDLRLQFATTSEHQGLVAEELQCFYRQDGRIEKMIDSILGRSGGGAHEISDDLKNALAACLDEGSVKTCCEELAASLADCLDGMIEHAQAASGWFSS